MNSQKIRRIFPFRVSMGWKARAPLFGKLTIDGKALFRTVVAIVVVLGIVFRLGNLAAKPYWEDEVYTSTLVAGYEMESIEADLEGKLTSVEALSKYQDVQLGQSWKNTSVALAKRPEHTPLYFLLARAWAECFGSSVTTMRAFPAVTSLLTLPLFYWLSVLLFESSEAAAIALCLACTSPILIRYAQDARPYSLWVVGILLSSAMLLYSLKHNQRRNWMLYSASVAFAVMTNWLSCFVFFAHGAQVLVVENDSQPQSQTMLKRFFIALSVGLLPVLPWAGLVIYGRQSVHAVLSWLEQEETLRTLSIKWLGNLGHLVFAWLPAGDRILLFSGPLLLLLVWSTIQLIAKNRVQQWLLPSLLCVVPMVAFGMPDLLFGGTRSLISRYFLAADVGAILILGFGLSNNSPKMTDRKSRWPKQVLFYTVLTISISSCWFNFNADNWWGEADFGRRAASSIAQTSSPVEVYSDQRLSPFLAFALSLRPKDRIMWLDEKSSLPSEILNSSKSVFLFEPSSTLLDQAMRTLAMYDVKGRQIASSTKVENVDPTLFEIVSAESE